MLFLSGKPKLADSAELKQALESGLSEFFHLDRSHRGSAVTVNGEIPELQCVRLDLTSARIDPNHLPPPPAKMADKGPSFTTDQLEVTANPLFFGRDAKVALKLEAAQVILELVRDKQEAHWLALEKVGHGHASINISGQDIENLFLSTAEVAAKEHGVAIHHGSVNLSQRGEREVSVEIDVTAKKFMMKSHFAIRGCIYIDKELNAHFSELSCQGKGTLGSLAAHYITPHLETWEEQPLPLLGLLFTGITLHDVGLEIDDHGTLNATAQFGD